MIISLNGPPGSGKSTIALILKDKLGLKNHYYIGGLRRKMAAEMGITVDELNKLGEKDSSTDMKVDEYQKKLGDSEDDFIIEGRTSFYFIPRSVKLYIDVEPRVGAERVWNSSKEELKTRNEKRYKSIEDVLRQQQERMESDRRRYAKYYPDMGDCYDKSKYDFVIDTSRMKVEQAVDSIMNFLKQKNYV